MSIKKNEVLCDYFTKNHSVAKNIIRDRMFKFNITEGDGTSVEDLFSSFIEHMLFKGTTNRINSEGQIPLENWTLNSRISSIGGQPIVRSSVIRTRTTGDIALEDGFGNLVLNGTDGSSTNAGDNMDLEGATGITI